MGNQTLPQDTKAASQLRTRTGLHSGQSLAECQNYAAWLQSEFERLYQTALSRGLQPPFTMPF